MEYTPAAILQKGLPEVSEDSLQSLAGPALVRRLKLAAYRIQDEHLLLETSGKTTLSVPVNQILCFGGEQISALDYFRRVLERSDLIDAVLRPGTVGILLADMFWIHIIYSGTPADAGDFSRKEDGLFAMRAKAGEKAERIVARTLRDECGHSFPTGMCESPGVFEIRYDKTKRSRKPDRKCQACGLEFEVKKRNRDEKFRVSHSPGRPFSVENPRDGWHAFVFPDMKPRFVLNTLIAEAIERGDFVPGSDQYDSWADIRSSVVVVERPPRCPAAKND